MKSAHSTDFRVGERVPGTDWVMHGVLGQGGMGIVLEVRKGHHMRAAMKVLHPGVAQSATFERRFAGEVDVLSRLRHPNIVEVRDCGVLANGHPFFVMELLAGRTLRAVIRDRRIPLTARVVWKITGQICAGLGHAHRDDPPVVHRDVKPENVFLHGPSHADAQVKLLDFGVAKVIDTARTPHEIAGTPRYMAPEVWRHDPVTPQVDLYAVAVLVYEILTQHFPWPVDEECEDAVIEAHRHKPPMAPSCWKRWIPPRVDACLLRALSKNPQDRQRSMGDFYKGLFELAALEEASPKIRMDVPTPPTAEAMAGAPENSLPQDWMEIARIGLTDAVRPFEATSTTVTLPGPEPGPAADPQEPIREHAEDGVAVPARGSTPSEPTALRVEPPRTGGPARRADRRGRIGPVVLLSGTGMIALAATWGGWNVRHSRPAFEAASPATPPSALAMAWAAAVDRAAAQAGSAEPTPDVAADTVARGSKAPAVASAAARAIPADRPSVLPSQASFPPRSPSHRDVSLGGPEPVPPPAPPAEPTPARSAPSRPTIDELILAGPPPETPTGSPIAPSGIAPVVGPARERENGAGPRLSVIADLRSGRTPTSRPTMDELILAGPRPENASADARAAPSTLIVTKGP
jgi:serine/threonine protein kinase